MKRIFVLICVFAAVGIVEMAQAKSKRVSRQIPVDESFVELESKFGGFAGGFEALVKIIAVDGKLEMCGAIVYTNAQLRDVSRSVLRDTDLKMNGKTILKGLNFFKNAKRKKNLPTAIANCRTTTAAVPKSEPDFEIKWPISSYRVN